MMRGALLLNRDAFNKGIAGAPIAAIAATKDTATNPFVVDAFVLVIIADGARPSDHGHASPSMDTTTARRNQHEISLAAAQLGKITPIADSYVSPASSVKKSTAATAISLHSDAGLSKSVPHAPQCLLQTGTLAIHRDPVKSRLSE